MGDKTFGQAFEDAMARASSIHFNLDGFDIVRAVNEGGTGGAVAFRRMATNYTSAEFMTIMNDANLLSKTTFYINGRVLFRGSALITY